MKLVIQRVKKATVKVVDTKKISGKINAGLFVLVGIGIDDTKGKVSILAEKLVRMRLMADEYKKMNLVAKEFLIVSQFTLYGNTNKGNRPSFAKAAKLQVAKELYNLFVSELKVLLKDTPDSKVETGSFGDYMQISAELDGPVTIVLEQ